MLRSGVAFHSIKIARELLATWDPKTKTPVSTLETNYDEIDRNLLQCMHQIRQYGNDRPVSLVFEDFQQDSTWLNQAYRLGTDHGFDMGEVWFQTDKV